MEHPTQPPMVITFTDAPESYDGFGTRTTAPCIGITASGKIMRQVETPAEHLEWQRDRYSSGMYMSMSSEKLAELRDLVLPNAKRVRLICPVGATSDIGGAYDNHPRAFTLSNQELHELGRDVLCEFCGAKCVPASSVSVLSR